VRSDDPELLILNKIYQVTLLENDLLKITDEADESAIYPVDYFLLVSFPAEVEKLLARVAKYLEASIIERCRSGFALSL
jgi:hypothetical protein